MLTEIWNELKDPDISPVSEVKLDKLNYFEDNENWINRRNDNLLKELQSILNILEGGASIVKKINVGLYAPSLAEVAKSMDPSDKAYLKKWIKVNMREKSRRENDREIKPIDNSRGSGVVIVDYTDPYESFCWRDSIHLEIDLDNKTITSAGWRNGSIPLSEAEAQKYLDFFSVTRNLNDFFDDRKAYSTPVDRSFEHAKWYTLKIQWNDRVKEISVGYPDIPFKHPFSMFW